MSSGYSAYHLCHPHYIGGSRIYLISNFVFLRKNSEVNAIISFEDRGDGRRSRRLSTCGEGHLGVAPIEYSANGNFGKQVSKRIPDNR